MSRCTIVIPCYNEARRLDPRAFVEHAARFNHEFLFVNDGSKDATRDVLEDLCSANVEQFSALHLPVNQGKAEAVRQGMLHAFQHRTPYTGFWDADLATPLDAIGSFERYLDSHAEVNLLLGARVRLLGRKIERKRTRHFLGRLFASVAARTLRLPVYDTQCGAKLFRVTPETRKIFAEPFLASWIFDVELVARYLVASCGASETIHEFPLAEWRDVAGSKVKPVDFARAGYELARIHRRYARAICTTECGFESQFEENYDMLDSDLSSATASSRRHVDEFV